MIKGRTCCCCCCEYTPQNEISWRPMYLHLTQLPLWEWLQMHLCTCSLSVSYSFYAFNSSFFRIQIKILQYLFPQFPHLHFHPHPRRYRLRHNSFTCHSSGAAVATFLLFYLRSALSLGTLFFTFENCIRALRLTPFFPIECFVSIFPLLFSCLCLIM